MTRARFLAASSLSLLLVSAASLTAFQKPNFSGTWVIQAPNKAEGVEVVVTQTEKTLTFAAGGRRQEQQLDGVEHKETRSMRGGDVVMVTKAGWEGKTIVITITIAYPNNMKTIGREVWSLDAQGQLIIERSEAPEGQKPVINRVVHKKKN